MPSQNPVRESQPKPTFKKIFETVKIARSEHPYILSDDVSLPVFRGSTNNRLDAYFNMSKEKIKKGKAILDTAKANGMDVKQRRKLRNKIWAQKTRVN